jgi:hypothetical protein
MHKPAEENSRKHRSQPVCKYGWEAKQVRVLSPAMQRRRSISCSDEYTPSVAYESGGEEQASKP